MVKRNNVLVLLILLMIIPFTIQTVSASWTYYEGSIPSISTTIIPGLGNFTYKPLPPYPHEYPDDPKDLENLDIFDKITGGNVAETPNKDGWEIPQKNDGISLADPKSPINTALERGNISRQRPYILSSDYFDTNEDGRIDSKDMTTKEYFFGKDADPNILFVIVRETFNDFFNQHYSIYSTNVPLQNLKVGDNVQYVYKTALLWKRNTSITEIAQGSYTITATGNTRGICKVIRADIINNKGTAVKKKFFDYKTFS